MRDIIKPKIDIQKTNALVYDQGITYNESGLTYNQLGIAYGGLYEYDLVPITPQIEIVMPSIVFSGDFGATIPQPPQGDSGMLIGILGLTYP